MPSGTLQNLSNAGFVRTPPAVAERIIRLVQFDGPSTVLDPTAGEGDLLIPVPTTARCYGVEISSERAAVAAWRMPQATIITAPIEQVRIEPGTLDLILANPPYFFENGQRAEYRILRDIGPALKPGGILVAILPARSAWDAAMVNHWARWYDTIRCWTFPVANEATDEASFERYTQIVVIGVRKSTPAKEIDPEVQRRLKGWRYRTPKYAESPWVGGTPPPTLPTVLIPDPYPVPLGGGAMPYRVLRASEDVLLDALAQSSVCHHQRWHEAMLPKLDILANQSIMPPTGKAHLAADILTGLLDGQIVQGPDGNHYVFASTVTTEWVAVEVDADVWEENQRRGVVNMQITQQQDRMSLRILNLSTGAIDEVNGEDAYATLEPWLPILVEQVLQKRSPLYQLQPYQWEMETLTRIGQQKRLPRSPHPGLVPAQIHRVCGMSRALTAQRRVMYQGEPGVGKTLQGIGLAALQATVWNNPERVMRESQLPTWRARLRRAWQKAERAKVLLQGRTAPTALPVLIVTPKRVTRTWLREIETAYPEARCIVIRRHTDIDLWMQQCAESDAPVVFALVPHSLSRTFTHVWRPVVEQRQQRRVIEAEDGASQEIIVCSFRCPNCGEVIHDRPTQQRKNKKTDADEQEDDTLEVVTSIEFFITKRRCCNQCHSPLWSMDRTTPAKLTYASWEQGQRMDRRPESLCPYEYLYQRYRGCVGMTIIDESHNGSGRSTDIAHAMHLAQLSSQTYVYASGTHYGGTLDKFFFYQYRFSPRFWQKLGYRWNDVERAVRDYGVVQQITKEYESDARRGTGVSDLHVSTIPAPGISARLIPHLVAEMVFMTILDIGTFMPPRQEIPVVVPMSDPLIAERVVAATCAVGAATAEDRPRLEQEQRRVAAWASDRDLCGCYSQIVDRLDELASQQNTAAMMAKGTIPRWYAAFPSAPEPYTVTQTTRDPWGKRLESKLLASCRVLAEDHRYPLECRLQVIVQQHVQQGQRVMVYYEQNGIRRLGKRLRWVLSDSVGTPPWILPDATEADAREDAIRAAIKGGSQVVIVPYRKVSEGLNLQDSVDVIVWYEMAMNLFLLEQASRRAWRPGREAPVAIYYLVYGGSVAHKKLRRLGGMSGAAAAFAGEPAQGALIEHAGADKTVLARLSKALSDEELAARFAERNRELNETLQRGRQWIGIDDPLPVMLDALYAARATQDEIVVESVPLSKVVPLGAPPEEPVVEQIQSQRVTKYTWDDLVAQVRARKKSRRPRPSTSQESVGLWDMPLQEGTTQPAMFD